MQLRVIKPCINKLRVKKARERELTKLKSFTDHSHTYFEDQKEESPLKKHVTKKEKELQRGHCHSHSHGDGHDHHSEHGDDCEVNRIKKLIWFKMKVHL